MAARYNKPRLAALRRDWLAIVRFAWQIRVIAHRQEHDFYLLNQWPLLHAMVLPRQAKMRTLLHWCEVRQSLIFRLFQGWLPRFVWLNAAISDSVATQIRVASGRDVITLPSGLDLSRALFRDLQDRSVILAIWQDNRAQKPP